MEEGRIKVRKMEYVMLCDTAWCGKEATHFIAPDDAPLNTAIKLCDECSLDIARKLLAYHGLKESRFRVDDSTRPLDGGKEIVDMPGLDIGASLTAAPGKRTRPPQQGDIKPGVPTGAK